MDDPLCHRITADDAYISIAANNLRGGEQYEGRWILKGESYLIHDSVPPPNSILLDINWKDVEVSKILISTLIDASCLSKIDTFMNPHLSGTKTRKGSRMFK